jgi:hypothetical protein
MCDTYTRSAIHRAHAGLHAGRLLLTCVDTRTGRRLTFHTLRRRRSAPTASRAVMSARQGAALRKAPPFPLLQLPAALLSAVLARAPAEARARCACVCRELRAVAEDPALWRGVDLRRASCAARRARS